MDIVVVNKSTVDLGIDFNFLVATMQSFVDNYFSPLWGRTAKLSISKTIPKKKALFLFLDDADVADALGYHDLTSGGFPISKVFVKTTLSDNQLISVTATHELAEMLVDPGCQMWAQNGNIFYALETADAVEEDSFTINRVPVTNFVLPSYFDGFRKTGPFDYLSLLDKPYSLRPGGYSIVMKAGKVTQIFGSKAKAKRFSLEDRRFHRSEYR